MKQFAGMDMSQLMGAAGLEQGQRTFTAPRANPNKNKDKRKRKAAKKARKKNKRR